MLIKTIENLRDLTIRNLKFKYASTFLGILWAGLIPIILMIAITFVFMKVLKIDQKDFHIFVLSGLIPWLYFTNLTTEATQAFVREKPMMHQFPFSHLLYPLSVTCSNLIQHLIGIAVLLPVFAFYNPALLYKFILLIIPTVSFTIFLAAVTIIISITNLYIRDLEHILGTVLMVLFWLTPVFYNPLMVPLRFRFIIYCNPLSYFIDLYRSVLLENYSSFMGRGNVYAFIFAVLFLILAYFLYKKMENSILKKI
ncbi:MAG: ABC transporter permease [Candidatus Saelkia tenebricola]|nr:ABC transporter permease [Candidatus Saelkia tenebricola]